MKLAEWLATTGSSAAVLAERCGVHEMTVYKWKDGTNVPRHKHLDALARATGGAVTANDFHAPAAEPAESGARTGKVAEPLLLEAEALGLDAAAICDAALRAAIRAAKAARWQDENRQAIEAHARYVEEHGLPLAENRML